MLRRCVHLADNQRTRNQQSRVQHGVLLPRKRNANRSVESKPSLTQRQSAVAQVYFFTRLKTSTVPPLTIRHVLVSTGMTVAL